MVSVGDKERGFLIFLRLFIARLRSEMGEVQSLET
jgi:hypothetical protein